MGKAKKENESMFTETDKLLFTPDLNMKRYANSDIVDKFEVGQCASTNYANGYGHGSRVHNLCITITTGMQNIPITKLKQEELSMPRIRKLTPLECLKLQGFNEEHFNSVKNDFSSSAIYHVAGDSITTTTLVSIFGEMTDLPYREIIQKYVETLKGDYDGTK